MNPQSELIANRYSRALWEAVGSADAQKMLESFEKFVEIYLSSDDLQKVLANPAFSGEQKRKVLTEISQKAELGEELQKFLLLLLERNRLQVMGDILEAFRERIMARDRVESVRIETALPITDVQKNKIIATLEKKYDAKFIASVDIVPDLIAGIKLHYLGRTVDSTLTGALFQMKQELLKQPVLNTKLGDRS